MKGKALRRALETSDVVRVNADIPLITDTTELITPGVAQEMLKRNKANRPVNWKKVEEYACIMARGDWQLHAQGLIFDNAGNLLTGQTRLWAVVYSESQVYMRVSRGNPPGAARLIDRGRPQSARDLATRETEKKHSPTEASIARGICALNGVMRPSLDQLAVVIAENTALASAVMSETAGTRKSKSVLMVLSAICASAKDVDDAKRMAIKTAKHADRLELSLQPHGADKCWGKGAAFGLALTQARKLVQA